MSLLSALADKLDGAANEVSRLTRQIAEANADGLADANRRQLFDGLRADDSEIEPPYAPMTVRLKLLKGQPAARVTLRDSGDFHASIETHIDDDTITLVATDSKTRELLDKYGDGVLGLSGEYVAYFRDRLLHPELLDGLRVYFHR